MKNCNLARSENLKKIILFLLALIFLVCGVIFSSPDKKINNGYLEIYSPDFSADNDNVPPSKDEDDGILLNVAILYSGNQSVCEDSLSHLKNALQTSMKCYTVNVDTMRDGDLDVFDVLYPDESIRNNENVKSVLQKYVFDGGNLFLTNSFLDFFDNDFLGISQRVKLNSVPKNLVNSCTDPDLSPVGEIVCDYLKLYSQYKNFDCLSKRDYGYGVKTTTAESVVQSGDTVIYGLNKYGKGTVLFTNPLLPNSFSINGFALKKTDSTQQPFAETTASANMLIKSKYASYVCKKKYGYSIERTFGSFGTKPIAWQLHYEEITGFENDSAILFSELCKRYNQIPSFTLIRNTYKWFARYETVTYLKYNNNICKLDLYEGAYSNGTHVVSDGKYLSLAEFDNAGSYFYEYPQYTSHTFPDFYDADFDGKKDIFVGSSDGYIYFYKSKGYVNGEFLTEKAEKLCDKNGSPLFVYSNSAPAVSDFDGDGIADIVCGCGDGSLYFFKGLSNLTFNTAIKLCQLDGTMSMPAVGDIDRDGELELVIGSQQGKVWSMEYANGFKAPSLMADVKSDGFASPCVFDLNGDGNNDIALGTFDGYVKRFISSAVGFYDGGYVMADNKNYKGNWRVKFGNNCTPRFFDVDGDGKDELFAGSLEYGLNVPIDSKYFPYREKLQKQINYILSNNFYLGTHFYTNEYASPEREQAELEMHLAAMKSYGIPTDKIGANQHTWFVSSNSPSQSYDSVKNAGLLWDSGSQASRSLAVPQASTENVLPLPFFTNDKNEMLVLDTGTLLYLDDSVSNITAKYEFPLPVYYHCDFTYSNPAGTEKDVKHVSDYAKRNGYSFVREDQLVKAAAASYNSDVFVHNSKDTIEISSSVKKTDFPLYDADFASCTGVKIEFADGVNLSSYSNDASVWRNDGKALYVSLDKKVSLKKLASGSFEKMHHIVSVNVPASFSQNDGRVIVTFKADGFLSLSVKGKAHTDNDGWNSSFENGITTFSKFSSADKLTVTFD